MPEHFIIRRQNLRKFPKFIFQSFHENHDGIIFEPGLNIHLHAVKADLIDQTQQMKKKTVEECRKECHKIGRIQTINLNEDVR